MKSYTTLRNLYGSLVNNTESANLTLGDQLINDGVRRIIASSQYWDFLEGSDTDTTVADQQSYQLPYDVDKVYTVTVTVDSYVYPVQEAPSRDFWNELNLTSFSADYPEYFYVDAGNLFLWPTPSTSSNTITFDYKKIVRDLANADYTTGTVTLTNDDETVTGAGTTFTAAMVGRWLKGDNDGYWYEIASFTSSTSIELRKKWQGTTTAGLSYTIGEMPILPEAYHDLPVQYAASQYWYQNGEINRAREYERLFQEGIIRLTRDHGSKTASMVLDDARDYEIINPNLLIKL